MFRKILTKIAVIAASIVLPLGGAVAFGGGYASASNPAAQICISPSPTGNVCLNAWGGGPWVKVETSMGAVPNDEFSINGLNNGNTYLEFVGGGTWNGWCLGDAYNDPNNDLVSVEQCPTNSNSGGWGTNFQEVTCTAGESYAFKNIHWGGYLQPTNNSNGSNFTLLGPKYCFTFFYPNQK